ncbi:ankyrin repeat domain-containing protein [Photobacterium sanguinicancri]|uniref:ankyrin repeat domain-containing protein n=1 Tax=Photobacterium sanguinicancri TaxID=875932 RepID=UPI0024804DB5|nr:ankyrin repeat domain-containing protein [Photobacterium sanguinicancri]
MPNIRRYLKSVALLIAGLLGACNLEGADMDASNFFQPEMVSLLQDIQRDNRKRAEQKIKSGVSLNVHGKDGITPLFWLIINKDKPAIKLALELGADPNFSDPVGDTPIVIVAGGNDDEMLEILLQAGANPNSLDSNGYPTLFAAIGTSNWAQIKMLINAGADINLPNKRNVNSAHHALYIGQYEIAYYLLELGVEHNERTPSGSDMAWRIHKSLSDFLLDTETDAYKWAAKVKQQLIDRGVSFPPPSPKEVRAKWAEEGRDN